VTATIFNLAILEVLRETQIWTPASFDAVADIVAGMEGRRWS
jgi:hypothetical protein